MDPLQQQRERVQDDLRGLIAGEVRCDPSFVQLYASDGSVYEIKPLGVVRPASTADVVACVQYAAESQIPIHARGAGSNVTGACLGRGLVLDFSTSMRRVLRVENGTIRVQAGAVFERVNSLLSRRGRTLPLDPANGRVTTIGGMLGLDASGSRRMKYGSVRRYVESLQIVLADGQVVEAGREPVGGGSPASNPKKQLLVERIFDALSRHADAILKHRSRSWPAHCGYQLGDVLEQGQLDLARLLVGSEGTLALITEATLSTVPVVRYRGVALLMFDRLEKAANTVFDVLPIEPTACDLMDRRHLSIVCEADPRFGVLVPRETEALMLVECEDNDPVELRSRLQAMIDNVQHQRRLAFGSRLTFEPYEVDVYWQLARRYQPGFYRMRGSTRPLPVVEDMAVGPDRLPEFLVSLQNVLKRHEVTASIFSHAGTGQIHLRPFLELAGGDDVERMKALAQDVYREVIDAGGVIGGENGCGLSRTAFLRQQYGELVDAFADLKRAFDPAARFNPGKIVGDNPHLLVRDLRPAIAAEQPEPQPASSSGITGKFRNMVELQMDWDTTRVARAASLCNGCGDCRTQVPAVRMCPLFRVLPAEEASPRAKANLLRGVVSGRLDLDALAGDRFKHIADLCVHCHMCRIECPAAVDVPHLMRESKAAWVSANGLPLAERLMLRLDTLDAVASLVSPLTNWIIGNRQMRWLLEKTLGVAQGRKLPRVTGRSFLGRTARRRWGRPSRHNQQKVLYFVDLYANYHDPQLGEALLAVMEHNHVDVYVPSGQRQSGMSAIACGALDYARLLAQRNVALLAEAVRQGYHIVATEPTAALCLVREYPQLLDDDDSRLVAANASEVCHYLWKLHGQGKLELDFKPVRAVLGYHAPCHLKALEVGTPSMSLMSLIPGLQVHAIEEGCSGMAGTYGLLRKNYRTSLRTGWGLISRLRDPEIQAGLTECSACKIQMEQGTTKPTLHPVKILALAYGLMPSVVNLLNKPGGPLVTT